MPALPARLPRPDSCATREGSTRDGARGHAPQPPVRDGASEPSIVTVWVGLLDDLAGQVSSLLGGEEKGRAGEYGGEGIGARSGLDSVLGAERNRIHGVAGA